LGIRKKTKGEERNSKFGGMFGEEGQTTLKSGPNPGPKRRANIVQQGHTRRKTNRWGQNIKNVVCRIPAWEVLVEEPGKGNRTAQRKGAAKSGGKRFEEPSEIGKTLVRGDRPCGGQVATGGGMH